MADVLTAADLLVVRACLAAGGSPTQSLAVLGCDRGDRLGHLIALVGAGRPLVDIVGDDLPGRAGVGQAAGALLRCLAVAEVSGAAAGPAVEAIVEGLGAQVRLDRVVAARTADARLTAHLLLALPLIGTALVAAVDPGARTFMVSPLGVVVAVVGVAMMALALLWSRALTARVGRAARRTDPLDPTGRDGTGLPTAEALELLGVATAAGMAVGPAAALVARFGPPPVRPAMTAIATRSAAGTTPAEALPDALAELAAVVDVADRWGAPVTPSLRLLAADLRERAHLAAEAAAERLAVHLVFPTTLLLVPAFGLLVVAPLVASALAGLDLGL